jgi:hypothetical protein
MISYLLLFYLFVVLCSASSMSIKWSDITMERHDWTTPKRSRCTELPNACFYDYHVLPFNLYLAVVCVLCFSMYVICIHWKIRLVHLNNNNNNNKWAFSLTQCCSNSDHVTISLSIVSFLINIWEDKLISGYFKNRFAMFVETLSLWC